MRERFARLRSVVVAVIVIVPVLAVGAARASVSPRPGRWSGSGDGGTIYFVISRVRGTTVLTDLVEHCADDTPSAGDIPWGSHPPPSNLNFRNMAAIGADGRIYRGFRVPHADISGFDYVLRGRLGAAQGTVTDEGSSDGDEGCTIRNAHVSRTGSGTLVDGDYTVIGGAEGTDVRISVFGEGAEVWWSGLFGTPIGGVEEDPALCAEVQAVSLGVGNGYMGQGSRSFASSDVALLGSVGFVGHFISPTRGVGGYLATSYPVCAGAGTLAWKLDQKAPPILPAVPLHARPAPPPRRRGPHRRRHHPRRVVRYVALGDSFSAGEGVAPYDPGTATRRDRCHRSTRAYSRLVSLPHIRFVRAFYACSGATTPDVLNGSRFGEAPQLSHPRVGRAQLVTISIGGNDAGFAKVLLQCTRLYGRLHHSRCYRHPDASRILGGIEALRGSLAGTYEAIRARTGPEAKTVVLGYPDLFPERGCRKLTAVFDPRAQRFMRAAGGVLDRVIVGAAADAHVRYVDVRRAFSHHELCARDEWVDFLVRPRARRLDAVTGSFHPNAAGQRAYARILRGVLRHVL